MLNKKLPSPFPMNNAFVTKTSHSRAFVRISYCPLFLVIAKTQKYPVFSDEVIFIPTIRGDINRLRCRRMDIVEH